MDKLELYYISSPERDETTLLASGNDLTQMLCTYFTDISGRAPTLEFNVETMRLRVSYIVGESHIYQFVLKKNGKPYIIPYDIRNDLQAMIDLWTS